MHYKEKIAQKNALRRRDDLNHLIMTHIPRWKLNAMRRFQTNPVISLFLKKWFGYEFHEDMDTFHVELRHRGKLIAKNY